MRDLLRLTRPVDLAFFSAAVLLGGWLAGGAAAFAGAAGGRLLLAALTGACVGCGANVVNDIYDLEIDRRNSPERPLAAGRVSVRAAWTLWVALAAVGVAAAFAASVAHGVVAAAAVPLLWAYSARLKRLPGVGHLFVGVAVALGVLYGALALEPGSAVVAPAVLAGVAVTCVLVAAREVVKAIPDVEGDRAGGARTLPVVLGPRRAAWVAGGAIGAVCAALPLLPLAGYDPLFAAYAVPVGGCLVAAAWPLLAADATADRRPSAWRGGAARSSAWIKAALALGVVALALAR